MLRTWLRISPLPALLLALMTSTPSSVAQDAGTVNWPTYHSNAQLTGFNPRETLVNARNVRFLQMKWAGVMDDLVDYSSPAIVNGVVYIGSTDGSLYAFDATGCGSDLCMPLWKGSGKAGGSIVSSPAVSQGMVFVGSTTKELLVFDAAGCGSAICSPVWTGTVGGGILQASPVVVNGVVRDYHLHARWYTRWLCVFPSQSDSLQFLVPSL
ncbi:MAG TPA: PQQ-binding-like beta-propeller repeat protein [Terriglobales bacterium]|nr:PQQ-binding-like beta-propeller repeat protein [Terriglobales bacterium]